jgi:ParB family chromosome partitioning protein
MAKPFSIARSLKEITISKVILTDKTFLFSYPERTPFLMESIRDLGLIEPPVLYPLTEGYQIVCGEGRIKALKELGAESFLALVIEEKKDPSELLLFSLESNLSRGLNLVEKALFLEKAEQYFSQEEIVHKILPKLGFTKHPNWYFYLKKIPRLSEPLRELLVMGRLNPKTIEIMADLEEKEQKEYFQIITSFNLTQSEQMETLEALRDFQKRNQGPCLIPEEIKVLFPIEDPNLRKKTFKEILQSIRYPNFSSKKGQMESIKRDLQKRGIQIEFSPFLENKRIFINFDLKDVDTLQKNLKIIEDYGKKILSLFE